MVQYNIYADVGHGAPLLVIRSSGRGFDQGLFTARGALGDDMADNYHVIVPSRFCYLGIPTPSDANAGPSATAYAHAALLDA